MTWVSGTTVWGWPAPAINQLLTRVICGEVPDGNGVTVASEHRWVRDWVKSYPAASVTAGSASVTLGTSEYAPERLGVSVRGFGIPAGATLSGWSNPVTLSAPATATGTGLVELYTDTIRTPASTDIPTGDMPNRCGYFSNVGTGTANNLATPNASSVRVTAPFTSNPGSSSWGWSVRIIVNTANTVPGNYSNAAAAVWIQNLETGAVPVGGSALTISAAGVATVANGLQVTFSDPSGTLVAGTAFIRSFTPTYLYGVDWWPMWHRTAGPATFATPPPGVAGTDWDIVDLAMPYGGHASYSGVCDRSMLLYGLAIKTATGMGSGDRYTVSFPMALGKCRISQGAANGVLSLDVGASKHTSITNDTAFRTPLRITNWVKGFTALSSASATAQYYMSVTADGIILVVNGDPALTGKSGTAFYSAFTPTEPGYDKFPVAFNIYTPDYTADYTGVSYPATQYPYWSQRRRQDGTAEAVRDWQTGWMRAEHQYWSNSYNYSGSVATDVTASIVAGNSTQPPALITPGLINFTSSGNTFGVAPRQGKPGTDGKWWLHQYVFAEGDWSATGTAADESRIQRGTLGRFRFVPEDGWANWDEITDTATGTKWLLLKPDYMGAGNRVRLSSNVFAGGVAIREA